MQEVVQDQLDYCKVIQMAWEEFDDRHEVKNIVDASAQVSTNHVYKIEFYDRQDVFAKLSDYGKYDHFREDHIIINNLANNLESPYNNFLADALVKKNELFIYRYHRADKKAWVAFYNPIRIRNKLPPRLDDKLIRTMGRELAKFHRCCTNVSNQLPHASKNIATDIRNLQKSIEKGKFQASPKELDIIQEHSEIFLDELSRLHYFNRLETIPTFVDWNIGNFSVRNNGKFYSRWDYDWFRVSSRVLDFYFFSRVVSNVGDRTVFSYQIDTLNEERFILFLKEYHRVFPLNETEVRLIKEAYRFFILNFVIKDGNHFFLPSFAKKLQEEAYNLYLPTIETNYNVEENSFVVGHDFMKFIYLHGFIT